jgi:hypothetical protein
LTNLLSCPDNHGVIILPLPEGHQNLARITRQGVPLVALDCPAWPSTSCGLIRALALTSCCAAWSSSATAIKRRFVCRRFT